MATDPLATPEFLAGFWEQFKDTILERLAAVEEAAEAVRHGSLGDDVRRRAEVAAHRLAGSLGTIGFPDGSRIALEIEGLLREGTLLVGPPASRLSDMTVALRQTLDRGPV